MLLKQINKAYWYIGVLLYSFFAFNNTETKENMYIYICSFVAFLLFGIALSVSFRRKDTFFTKRNLLFSVFIVSLIQVIMLSFLSYSIDGDLFLFSKVDAMGYYYHPLKMSEMEFWDSTNYALQYYDFSSLGAVIWFSTLFRISQSLLFVKLIHVFLGVVSSFLLFDIGCYFMPRRYAYMMSLTFFIASFTAVLHTVLLKEIFFVFLVIAAFRAFYEFLSSKNILYLLIALFLSVTVGFFRVPVAILLVFAFVITLIFIYTRGVFAIVLGFIFTVFVMTSSYFAFTYERYLRGGDFEQIIERKEELAMGGGIIKHVADPLAALIGPFPSIVVNKISNTPLNASGLLFRMLLAAPFILGSYYVFRLKQKMLYPLVFFFLTNAIGVAISVKGLELRLTYPHLAMAYIVAFWWLSKYDYNRLPFKLSSSIIYGWFVIVFVLSVVWNLR